MIWNIRTSFLIPFPLFPFVCTRLYICIHLYATMLQYLRLETVRVLQRCHSHSESASQVSVLAIFWFQSFVLPCKKVGICVGPQMFLQFVQYLFFCDLLWRFCMMLCTFWLKSFSTSNVKRTCSYADLKLKGKQNNKKTSDNYANTYGTICKYRQISTYTPFGWIRSGSFGKPTGAKPTYLRQHFQHLCIPAVSRPASTTDW